MGIHSLAKGALQRWAVPGTLWASILSMILMGVIAATTGSLLPSIVADLGLSSAQAGLLVSMPSFGYVLASVLAGLAGDALGFRWVWLVGLGLALLGSLGVALAGSFQVVLPGMLALGLVGGLLDSSINPVLAGRARERAGGTLNSVHLFFGLGATLMPLLVGVGLRYGAPWRWHLAVPGLLALVVALVVAWAAFPARGSQAQAQQVRWGAVWRPLPWAVVSAMLYGGAEVGLLSWLALYLVREAGVSVGPASFAVSLFALMMMLGRGLCGRYAERIGYRRLIQAGGVAAALGVAAMLLLPGVVLPWFGVALAGLALSGIFPTLLADVPARLPGREGAVVGVLCSSSGVGKIAIPWLVGLIAEGAGLTSGMWLLAVVGLLLAVAYGRAAAGLDQKTPETPA
ncbi:MAG: MFS transporter [Anaerolineae bacterium]